MSGLKQAEPVEHAEPAFVDSLRRMNGGEVDQSSLSAVWSGELDDPFASAVVVGTAALVLSRLQKISEVQARERAEILWTDRRKPVAA